MTIRLHRKFEKILRKLKKSERLRVKERLVLFSRDEFNSTLNNHPLQGKLKGYRSINIGGDLRAVYRRMGAHECLFMALGTHSELYE